MHFCQQNFFLSSIIVVNVVKNVFLSSKQRSSAINCEQHQCNYHGVQDMVAWLPMLDLLFAHDNRKNDKNASLCKWNINHA